MDKEYQPLISNLSSSTVLFKNVFSGKGYLHNIFINSNDGAVISLANGTSSVIGLQHSSITIATGERELKFHGEPYETGLVVQMSGTASITVQYRKN